MIYLCSSLFFKVVSELGLIFFMILQTLPLQLGSSKLAFLSPTLLNEGYLRSVKPCQMFNQEAQTAIVTLIKKSSRKGEKLCS